MGIKVRIGNEYFDSEKELISIIFPNDEERKDFGKQISNMVPKTGLRAYVAGPDGTTEEEVIKFLRGE